MGVLVNEKYASADAKGVLYRLWTLIAFCNTLQTCRIPHHLLRAMKATELVMRATQTASLDGNMDELAASAVVSS